MTTKPSQLRRFAIRYAQIGWPVFPCDGKKPLTAHGFHDATTDPDTIDEWWGKNPNANVGVAVPAGLIVVDVDDADGLQRLKAKGCNLPTTTTCRTGRGHHYYYRVNGGELHQRRLDPGVDVRVGGRGYVIVPPSLHADTGRAYEWEVPPRREADAPGWLITAVRSEKPSAAPQSGGVLAGVEQGQRNHEVFRQACRLRRAGVSFEYARETVLNMAARCQPPLSEREALKCLESAYKRYEPVPEFAARVKCMASVEPTRVEFLFHPYVPVGKLSLVVGDPGQGKSFLVAAFATALSQAEGLPGGPRLPEPLASLIFTAEDGLADTLRPRLDDMGADVGLVHAFDSPIDLSGDQGMEFVREQIRLIRPALVAVDPMVAYVGAETDTYRANQVRAIQASLARLAEEECCAVVAVLHLNKGRGGVAVQRVEGSIDFVAAARSVLLVGSDPDNPRQKVLVHVKSNVAPRGGSLGFKIDQGQFLWTGKSNLTEEDVLAGVMDVETRSAIADAAAFLRAELAAGPKPQKEIRRLAGEQDISSSTLQRASKKIGVKKDKAGWGGGWQWSL